MAVAANNLFPDYIPREEERQIVAAVGRVRGSGNSEAVLLYGPGGVGKTWLVRELPERQATTGRWPGCTPSTSTTTSTGC